MYDRDDRENFMDLLRPPLGYRLDLAVGTTFSLDFTALTAALLALIDLDEGDIQKPENEVDKLQAITRLSKRVRIFVDRGQISLPSETRISRLFSLYDRIVKEIRIEGGRFHPKVWILRFAPKSLKWSSVLPPLIRIVCCSRNLTLSRDWELSCAFEGEENLAKLPKRGINLEIEQFVKALPFSEDPDDQDLLLKLKKGLSITSFSVIKEFQDSLEFLWQWKDGKPLWQHFPRNGNRILIVSPFLKESFLQGVVERFRELIIISSQEALDELADKFYQKISNQKLFVVQPEEPGDGTSSLGLHAKLFICEDDEQRVTFLGSANATGAAWRAGNCEAIVKFSPGVSIKQFCKNFVFREGNQLNGWIQRYQRGRTQGSDIKQTKIENLQRALSSLSIDAAYVADSKRIILKANQPVPKDQDFEVSICPLSMLEKNPNFQLAYGLFPSGLAFQPVEIEDLTEFLVIKITALSGFPEKRFVLKAKTNFGVFERERDGQFLRACLDRARFQQFLWAILTDSFRRSGGNVGGGQSTKDPAGGPFQGILGEVTIEDVIEACTEDSSRIDEIDHLLEQFEKTGFIDDAFRSFWTEFKEAQETFDGVKNQT